MCWLSALLHSSQEQVWWVELLWWIWPHGFGSRIVACALFMSRQMSSRVGAAYCTAFWVPVDEISSVTRDQLGIAAAPRNQSCWRAAEMGSVLLLRAALPAHPCTGLCQAFCSQAFDARSLSWVCLGHTRPWCFFLPFWSVQSHLLAKPRNNNCVFYFPSNSLGRSLHICNISSCFLQHLCKGCLQAAQWIRWEVWHRASSPFQFIRPIGPTRVWWYPYPDNAQFPLQPSFSLPHFFDGSNFCQPIPPSSPSHCKKEGHVHSVKKLLPACGEVLWICSDSREPRIWCLFVIFAGPHIVQTSVLYHSFVLYCQKYSTTNLPVYLACMTVNLHLCGCKFSQHLWNCSVARLEDDARNVSRFEWELNLVVNRQRLRNIWQCRFCCR